MPQNKPPGSNYSFRVISGSNPDCWYLRISQGPQTFSLYAETSEEKKHFLGKLDTLQETLTELRTKLEKQND